MRISDRCRILVVMAGAAVTACSSEPKAPDPVAVAPAEDRIECALAGAAAFGRDCSIEQVATDKGVDLILHHRDGGFRRLRVTDEGIVAADGAEQPEGGETGGQIEISIGGDRYRLPAAALGISEPTV